MADAISLLREQHAEVNALLMKLERVDDPALRSSVFRTIDAQLRMHAALEETIFYPAFKERVRNQSQVSEVEENYHEHADVKRALEEIERMDSASDGFLPAIQHLKMLVRDHVDEEEDRMFKEARRLFSARALVDVGYLMEAAERTASPIYEMAGPRVAAAR